MILDKCMKRYKKIIREAKQAYNEKMLFNAVMQSLAEQKVEQDREEEQAFIERWARENKFQL